MGKKSKDEDSADEELESGIDVTSDDATDSTDLSELKGTEDQSLVGKIKGLLSRGPSREDKASLKGASPSNKKNSRVIQVLVVIGLITFLFSDYIVPPEEETPDLSSNPSLKLKKRNKKKPVTTSESGANVKPDSAEATVEPPGAVTENSSTLAESNPRTEASPGEEVSAESAAQEASGSEKVSESPIDETSQTSEASATEAPVTEAPVEEPSITESTVAKPSEESGESKSSPSDNTEQVDQNVQTSEQESSLTDQILQDLEKQVKESEEQKKTVKEYVSPPDYEYTGRGLVYNCQGKHWACVDGPSYKKCEENASSVNYFRKKTECHPFNVYETPKGCQNMQNRMVTSAAKTNFCGD